MKTKLFIGMKDVGKYLERDSNELLKNTVRNYEKYVNAKLEEQIKIHALPKIKGAITVGKMKWRGITIGRCVETNEYWAIQRGVQIGEKIKVDLGFNVKDPVIKKDLFEKGYDSFL